MNPESSTRTARISRRQLLYALSIGGAGTALEWQVPVYAAQAGPAPAAPALAPLNRFPRMVQEFFVARENSLHQQRLERLAALKTQADAPTRLTPRAMSAIVVVAGFVSRSPIARAITMGPSAPMSELRAIMTAMSAIRPR